MEVLGQRINVLKIYICACMHTHTYFCMCTIKALSIGWQQSILPPAMEESSVSFQPHQQMLLKFWISANLIIVIILICISLSWDIEHLVIYFFYSVKCVFISFAHFYVQLLAFSPLISWAPCVFERLALCNVDYKYIFPVCHWTFEFTIKL